MDINIMFKYRKKQFQIDQGQHYLLQTEIHASVDCSSSIVYRFVGKHENDMHYHKMVAIKHRVASKGSSTLLLAYLMNNILSHV